MINIPQIAPAELFKLNDDNATFMIKAHANAKKEYIGNIATDAQGKKFLNIYVSASPINDQANKAIIKLLANSWKLKKSQFKIIHGNHQPRKVIKITS